MKKVTLDELWYAVTDEDKSKQRYLAKQKAAQKLHDFRQARARMDIRRKERLLKDGNKMRKSPVRRKRKLKG